MNNVSSAGEGIRKFSPEQAELRAFARFFASGGVNRRPYELRQVGL